MTNAIRAYFESLAPTWDSRMPPELDQTLRQMVAPFGELFSAAQAILEIGTGTGALIPHLIDYADESRLISIDLARGMLVRAGTRCPAVNLAQADVHQLPFAAATLFDVVVCHNSFPHFSDRPRALHEIRRVLRPGGRLLILHNNPRERVNTIHAQAGGAVAHDLLPPGAELRALLAQAGFADVWVADTPEHYQAGAVRP